MYVGSTGRRRVRRGAEPPDRGRRADDADMPLATCQYLDYNSQRRKSSGRCVCRSVAMRASLAVLVACGAALLSVASSNEDSHHVRVSSMRSCPGLSHGRRHTALPKVVPCVAGAENCGFGAVSEATSRCVRRAVAVWRAWPVLSCCLTFKHNMPVLPCLVCTGGSPLPCTAARKWACV